MTFQDKTVFAAALSLALTGAAAADDRPWPEILDAARGQTVFWNAWGGDDKTNAFIAWAGDEVSRRYGVTIAHVKLTDTAEAVSRVVAEKAAGRESGGSVDLVWINGPNFFAMKDQSLLYGPFVESLPNYALVDEIGKPSNIVDFTIPVEGYAAPWRVAQIAFVYDSARVERSDLPGSMTAMGPWAAANPGRVTHPNARNFLGATFLKQALYELVEDRALLQQPATDDNFDVVTAPLWRWYDAIRPNLWRGGVEFPGSSADLDRLLDDGEIEIAITFNPATAALLSESGLLPETARVFFLDDGTIGNTSFVAIPFNAENREGAMVVADFLMSPQAQARAQDPTVLGAFTVLDLERLDAAERAAFETSANHPAMPSPAEIPPIQLEPHPSWMTRIVEAWEARTAR